MPINKMSSPATSFDIKSGSLELIVLRIKSADLNLLRDDFARRFAEMPNFFEQDELVIDLSQLRRGSSDLPAFETPIEFSIVISMLRDYQLRPLAVQGANEKQTTAAIAAGLVPCPGILMPKAKPEFRHRADPSVLAPPEDALVIDKPLRSGQQVYARGRDLVMMAQVNSGAEVIADGHIHVYAPLLGKALAGALGNVRARIFSVFMAPELVSIAGIYSTGDGKVPESVYGKTAQFSLIETMAGGKLIADLVDA